MKNESMPAFPTSGRTDHRGCTVERGELGITKLEYFAGLAMQGDWAAQGVGIGFFPNATQDEDLEGRAKLYIRAAKIFIAELEKHQ